MKKRLAAQTPSDPSGLRTGARQARSVIHHVQHLLRGYMLCHMPFCFIIQSRFETNKMGERQLEEI